MRTLKLYTTDGDTLEIEIGADRVNLRLYDTRRQSPEDHTAIPLARESARELKDALNEEIS